jgi:hypothetical protein
MLASSRKILAAIAIAGFSIAGTAAIAQQAAPPAPPEKHGPWGGEHHHMLPGQMIEARLAYIKTALQITPAQTAQWNTVADVLRKHAKARDEKIEAMRSKMEGQKDGHPRPDFVERLEHRQKSLAEASADTTELLAAVKPLYATFSDSQKEIAAEVLGGHGHGGGWHHEGGR